MAWKVYGFMEGQDGNPRFKSRGATVYGPLPRKRWIAMPGEKRPRAKKVTMGSTRGTFDRDEQARKGIEYARWLASRDGIALPEGSACAIWADVTLPTGKTQMRVSCVMFYGKPDKVRIDIPNWNFIPAEPILEINHDYFRDLLATPCEAEALEIAA